MVHSNEILNELNDLSELVASLPLESPYQVPDGYFENLAGNLMNRIETLEEGKSFSFLTNISRSTPLAGPLSSYFDELSVIIIKRIKLEEVISQKEELEILSPLLGQLNKTVPFKLPEGYFNEFPSDIIAGVNAVDYVNQELESNEPVISKSKIKNVYQVPEDYFENLEKDLLSNVKGKQKTSVISVNFSRRAVRYSVAALVAGVISIAAWMFFQGKPIANSGDALAEMEKISNDEMINYLETTPAEGDIVSTAAYTIQEEDVKDLLTDLPDEELEQYLEHNAVLKDLTIN